MSPRSRTGPFGTRLRRLAAAVCLCAAKMALAGDLPTAVAEKFLSSNTGSTGSAQGGLQASCAARWSNGDADASPPEIQHVWPSSIGLGSLITVELTPASGAKYLECLSRSGEVPVLFLDDIALPSLKPVAMYRDERAHRSVKLEFRLSRSAADASAWDELLRRAWQREGAAVGVRIGIGHKPPFEATPAWPADTVKASLALRPVGPPFGLALLLLAALLLGLLSSRTEWVRDRPPSVDVPAGPQGSGRSLSFARLQFAAWSLTVLACILAGWLASGALPPFTGALATLVTISGVTAAAGAGVGNFRGVEARASEGLWRDLVHDADGLAVHRLQALVVNLLLLVVVWQQLIGEGLVPPLDKEWSGLLGISAGAYALGKTSESIFPK